MECAGKMPVLRECGGWMMWRMVGLLLGGKTIPPYIRVSCARGGPGEQRWRGETGLAWEMRGEVFGFSGGAQRQKCRSRAWGVRPA